VIDEAHYMLRSDAAKSMLNLFARHSRHYDSGLTLISQTVDEFMADQAAKEIYDQCDIRALMRHKDIGREAMQALDLTERERKFVMDAQQGNSADFSECLLHVTDIGKIRLRVFAYDFERHIIDTDLSAYGFSVDRELLSLDEIPDEQDRQRAKQALAVNDMPNDEPVDIVVPDG
jgi:hypothetical protein